MEAKPSLWPPHIGNLVTLKPLDGKPLPAVTRPVTRSLCAQLLANAQAAEKKQKPVAVNVVKKKAVAKPKPPPVPEDVTIIEISPDTVEKSKPESSYSRNKKPQASLTSTLTARSKIKF